jgi:hypothetical protein
LGCRSTTGRRSRPEERAAVRHLEEAALHLAGVGEGALLVAEQLESRKVAESPAQLISTKGERARGLSPCVSCATQLFPVPLSPCRRSVVSLDGGEELHLPRQLAHPRGAAQRAGATLLHHPLGQGVVGAAQLHLLHRALGGGAQVVQVHRLGEEALAPARIASTAVPTSAWPVSITTVAPREMSTSST